MKGFPYWRKVHTFDKMNIFTLKNSTCASLYPNRIKAQFLCGEMKNSGEPLPFIRIRDADLKTFCHVSSILEDLKNASHVIVILYLTAKPNSFGYNNL